MKKNILTFALLLAAFTSCSHEDIPVQTAEPIAAPVLSRSITATTATIVGYSADGKIVFNHNLHQTDAEANTWEWYPATNRPTQAELDLAEELVCLVPAQNVTGTTLSISPKADGQLMWDKIHVDHQHTDGRFYFDQVRHRLAKICVEVDHFHPNDYFYASYHPGGTFDCLTGEFTALDEIDPMIIIPQDNGEGIYTTTFSVVPQTFESEAELLRYDEIMDTGYQSYIYANEEKPFKLNANHMLHLHPLWGTADWTMGDFVANKVTGVSLNYTARTLYVGNTLTLKATVAPTDAHDQSVTWTSSKTSVATVSKSGKVTAKGNGTATITVKTNDGGYTATCKVTVKTRVTSVSLNTTSKTIYVGDTFQLTATVAPSTASNKSVTWTSSNTSVATVSSTGKVTGIKSGEATITVTTKDGSKKATCIVTVDSSVTPDGPGVTDWENGTTNNGNATLQ